MRKLTVTLINNRTGQRMEISILELLDLLECAGCYLDLTDDRGVAEQDNLTALSHFLNAD